MPEKNKKRKPGRPKGTAEFTAGILQFAVTPKMMDGVEAVRKGSKLPSLSESGRVLLEEALKARGLL